MMMIIDGLILRLYLTIICYRMGWWLVGSRGKGWSIIRSLYWMKDIMLSRLLRMGPLFSWGSRIWMMLRKSYRGLLRLRKSCRSLVVNSIRNIRGLLMLMKLRLLLRLSKLWEVGSIINVRIGWWVLKNRSIKGKKYSIYYLHWLGISVKGKEKVNRMKVNRRIDTKRLRNANHSWWIYWG